MKPFLRVVRDISLLLARIGMGIVLLAHGWYRWQVMTVPREVEFLETAGLSNATAIVWLVIAFEVVGGVLLIFGLATPLVGLGIILLNAATVVLVKDEFYLQQQGWEYNAVQGVVGLLLLAHGSGRAGLDNLFVRPKDEGGELIVGEHEADRIQTQEF